MRSKTFFQMKKSDLHYSSKVNLKYAGADPGFPVRRCQPSERGVH